MEQIKRELDAVKRNTLPKRSVAEVKSLAQELLNKMTLEEKIGQLYQSGHDSTEVTGPAFDASKTVENISKGAVGSIIGLNDNLICYQLQKKALESRLGIPLLFCADIIHGCFTGFPVNLALSCSFDEKLIEECCKITAYEASHSGVDLTFSPMLDLVHDPRWGRVMESNGEDTYLSTRLARAYIRGYQQDNLEGYDSIATCAKHYIGYGLAEGGRDYNSVDMSKYRLHESYLPPFKAAFDEGCPMVMTSFNIFDGVPVTVNKYLLRDVLRDELKFDGVVISDYTSSGEVLNHGAAKDDKDVAYKSITAGLDHEMIYPSYINHLKELILNGEVEERLVDEACLRVLELKYKLGLFDNPFKHLYSNPLDYSMKEEFLAKAKDAATKSAVLLENDGVLPFAKDKKIALIGPYADYNSLIGPWGGKTDINDCKTLREVFEERGLDVLTSNGCGFTEMDYSHFEEAIEIAKKQDIIVFACGEPRNMSGEAASRAYLDLPGVQEELLHELSKLGKPIVMLVFAGRPLILTKIRKHVNAIMYCWFLGTSTSDAIYELLTGIANPSAKLTMSFPYAVGQIPVYYNALPTGRPKTLPGIDQFYHSRYIDIPNTPLYPFGYGLSYSKFEYSNFGVVNNTTKDKVEVLVSVDVTNVSEIKGDEIVQLYIHAVASSVSRPYLELKEFAKVALNPNETKRVTFKLTKDTFTHYLNDNYQLDKGKYEIFVGTSSTTLSKETIEI